MPMKMDKVLLPQCSNSGRLRTDSVFLPFGIENGLALVVVTAIFGSLWGHIRGEEERTKAIGSSSVTPNMTPH